MTANPNTAVSMIAGMAYVATVPVATQRASTAHPATNCCPRPIASRRRRVVAQAAHTGREPQWFKVRVVDRGTGRKKVTINLPLSLVRALGDDTIDWGCRSGEGNREKCHSVRLSEVLRSLEAGQELVEIEDDEATVKVWVE